MHGDERKRDSEMICYRLLRAPFSAKPANCINIGNGQLLPRHSITPSVTPFGYHVRCIVLVKSKAQMLVIHARWVIARMHDDHPLRDCAMNELIG